MGQEREERPPSLTNIVIKFEEKSNFYSDYSFGCLFSQSIFLYSLFCMALVGNHLRKTTKNLNFGWGFGTGRSKKNVKNPPLSAHNIYHPNRKALGMSTYLSAHMPTLCLSMIHCVRSLKKVEEKFYCMNQTCREKGGHMRTRARTHMRATLQVLRP